MGLVLKASCKKCNYQSNDLSFGSGMVSETWNCIIADQTDKTISSLKITKGTMPDEKYQVYDVEWVAESANNEVLKIVQLSEGRICKKSFGKKIYENENGLSRKIVFALYHPLFLLNLKKLGYIEHKCPRCNNYSIQFKTIALWD